jgi:UDPglucose 6-dehydrogenase
MGRTTRRPALTRLHRRCQLYASVSQQTSHRATGHKIAIIGTGYVGLTAAACFAHLGHDVICSDISEARVDRLIAGEITLVEEGLPEMVRAMTAAGRLRFTTDNLFAVANVDYVFLCLPTPDGGDGRADLSFVLTVAGEVGPHLRSGCIVINKSTVPVGTAQMVAAELDRTDVEVVSNPEFLAEGTALRDFMEPDRVVVGSDSQPAAVRVADLYASLSPRVIVTDVASAELIKYASNAFLATKLTFVNSLAGICEEVGADIRLVAEGMGADARIGPKFLKAGPGWGGSCFPKDTKALVSTARDFGTPFALLEAAVLANQDHQVAILTKIERALPDGLEGSTIAVWGLTFKAGTDDMRDSPARDLAVVLAQRGATVQAYDPGAHADVEGVTICATAIEACRGAALLLVATEWSEFSAVNLGDVASVMSNGVVVDARNVIDESAANQAGLAFVGLGFRSATTALANRGRTRMSA